MISKTSTTPSSIYLPGSRHALGAILLLAIVAGCFPAWAAQMTCNARAYGAKANGTAKDTRAIQSAIDDCARHGGGIVELTSGTFLSGPIVLKSNITFKLDKGATLLGSPDHADYPAITEFREPGIQSLVSAKNASNVSIVGGGVIDGNGQSWWTMARKFKNSGVMGNSHPRPRLVVFDHCKHVLVEGVTIQNSPMWQLVPYYSDDVTIRNIKVLAPAHSPNTDAIDPFSSSNVVIDHVYADVGDDDVAIKSGAINSPGPDSPSKNIRITNSVFAHGHGLSIGSEIAGGAQNIIGEHIQFKGTDNGIRIKANRDRGHGVSGIVFRDIQMQGVKTAILISEYYPKVLPSGPQKAAPVTRLTPHFHNILIENLTATDSKRAGVIAGLPEAPVKDVVLKNVSISAAKGMTISYAHVTAENLHIQAQSGPSIDKLEGAKLSSR